MVRTYNLKNLQANDPYFANDEIPATEIGIAKRRMDGAYRRMANLSTEIVRLGKILKEKREPLEEEEGTQKATNATLVATRVKYNQAKIDLRVAKADYRLYKKQYVNGARQFTKHRRKESREKIDVTRIMIQLPEMQRDVCAALFKAYTETHRDEIADMRLMAQEGLRKDFREKFDTYMPVIDEALFQKVSQVATLKTEVIVAAMKFLRALPEEPSVAPSAQSEKSRVYKKSHLKSSSTHNEEAA